MIIISFHPIIYLREDNIDYFLGVMMTHSRGFGNIKLEKHHFQQKIDKNPKPSFIVQNYLIKRQEWAPFNKVGQLSAVGIDFLKTRLIGTYPQFWGNLNP